MKLRKLAALVMAGMMALSMAACGGAVSVDGEKPAAEAGTEKRTGRLICRQSRNTTHIRRASLKDPPEISRRSCGIPRGGNHVISERTVIPRGN